MYESFYNLKEKPFTLLPDPGFLFMSKKHQMALTLLEYGLYDHAGFTVISGEIGAGKTTLIRHMLNNMEHEYTVGLISNTHRSFGELLQWILLAFNLEHRDMNKVEMYQRFVDFIIGEYSQNRRTVLIVDEAQNMDAETLEELRMLSNVNADKDQSLQVILVGQRELRETLQRPDLVQFAQRITVDYHLEPLSEKETAGYIAHRMQVAGGDPQTFTPAACAAVHRFSGGVPRLINLLCDTALVYGFAEQNNRIDAQLVTDVAREKQQGGIFPVYADASDETFLPETEAGVAAKALSAEPDTGAATATEVTANVGIQDSDGPTVDDDNEDRQEATDAPLAVEKRLSSGPVKIELAGTSGNNKPEQKPEQKPVTPEAEITQFIDVTVEPAQSSAPIAGADRGLHSDEEYRWKHGHKKKLRIVVCAAEDGLRQYLSRLLESYGFDVLAAVPLEAARLSALEAAQPDVLLLNRDMDSPLPANVSDLMTRWTRPVMYCDNAITARSLREVNPDFGRQLSSRINSLVHSSGTEHAATT